MTTSNAKCPQPAGQSTGYGLPNEVLLVEDDLATLYALERLFRTQGWRVSTSRTVESALVKLESVPDWVVLDLELTDGSGEEVLRYIRDEGIASRVAVVSALPTVAYLPSVTLLRPDVVMEKPIRFETLLAACGISSQDLSDPTPPG